MTLIPEEYRTPYLFLLVGKNPLPNYVAIQLLQPEKGHVYLVHTTETAPIAERIRVESGLIYGETATKIPINDADPGNIMCQIKRHAEGKARIGLNYTGGTKHMALHVYQAIRDATATYGTTPVLSYLNARTLQMQIEQSGHSLGQWPVGLAVRPMIRKLLALHGYTANEYGDRPFDPDIYPDLVRIGHKHLVRWRQKAFKGMSGRTGEIPLPVEGVFSRLEPHWRGATTIGELAQQWDTTPAEISTFLAGHWLEHYTLASLQGIADEVDIHDCGMNVKPLERDFEFDVIAMRGYQLFAISCTTAEDKKTIKLKLFEAYVRARQMGGDEARIGVVCRAPAQSLEGNASAIQEELAEKLDATDRIRVFGEESLRNLPKHLQNWLTG